jgi:hypothetical protein
MSDRKQYHRHEARIAGMHLEYLKSVLGPTATAVHRSWLRSNGFARLPADGPGKRKWVRRAKKQRPEWIVHVKDGQPLTALGAQLLGVPWEGCGDR